MVKDFTLSCVQCNHMNQIFNAHLNFPVLSGHRIWFEHLSRMYFGGIFLFCLFNWNKAFFPIFSYSWFSP